MNKEDLLRQPPQGFVDISGYEGRYAISREGVVYSYNKKLGKQGGVLKTTINRLGYVECCLTDSFGKQKNVRVHRLVINAYINNPKPKLYKEVNHINGVKTDNRLGNLEWCTRSQNLKHAYKMGLKHFPGKMGNIVLSAWEEGRKKANVARSKPITQLSENGQVIQRFRSIREAARIVKTTNASTIAAVLNEKKESAGGFKWMFSD